MTDDPDLGNAAGEPSPEDFVEAESERRPTGPRVVMVRILRLVGVLFVIVALLMYFVVPFRNVVSDAIRTLRRPGTLNTIPLAPQEKGAPKLPV